MHAIPPPPPTAQARRARRPPRRGAALLMCLFVIFMVSSLVLNVLSTEVVQFAATRNVMDYERALYLANAGVHHACTQLIADSTWRGTVGDSGYPGDDTYQATAANGSSGQVVITAVGVAGGATRTVEATIEL
ncbi:MAG: hypothetical protein AAF790_15180 [Planctomycetota bacterium]